MRENVSLLAFNRGIISRLALARTDLKRSALSAEMQTNWMPRTLGSMMLRPGGEYLGATFFQYPAIHIPFIFANDDMAIIEITSGGVRVRVDEQVITRSAVTTTITNDDFDTDLTGWTDADEAGATSAWVSGGYMSLVGTRFNSAIRKQTVTVSPANMNREHSLAISVARGPVTIRIGSADGLDDYVSETDLAEGRHSLAFTPVGNFYISVSNVREAASYLDFIAIEATTDTDMQIPGPWGEDDLPYIRWDQSGDVVFVSCDGFQQYRIERRATRSWSVVKYLPEDGPFRTQNTGTLSITPSALSGDVTLTASAALFRTTHVGALFKITSIGQVVSANLTGANQFTDPIKVTGTGSQREFDYSITGTWSGTITLQRSVDDAASWTDYTTYAVNATNNIVDGLDNQIVYYRIGFKTAEYTSGTAAVSLTYASGGLTGIARITAYTSSTSVSAAVLTPFGNTTASSTWSEGAWSDYRGWPTAVAFHEGRLWWAGRDKLWGSVSDAFASFDEETEGDSGPISRSIGSGPVDVINWLLPLQRLIAGGQGAEHSIRSSSLDEPLTPSNFNIKTPSTHGSAAVPAVRVDATGVFVNKGRTRLFELSLENEYSSLDYRPSDLTVIAPEITEPLITRIAVQRMPDTRIHCVLADGTVAILIYDPAEEVKCWVPYETDGTVEDVFVLPGEVEDKVYYLVLRTINGSEVRYLERWALESECQGGTLNKNIDCHYVYSGPSKTEITGLDHLEGETVCAWGNGKDLGTYTVTTGAITLSEAVTGAVIGLTYTAQFKSAKLAYAAQMGSALGQRKRIHSLALILANTHYQGLQYGPDFDNLDDLPLVEDGAITAENYVWDSYDKDAFTFPGTYDTDSRLCLQASAPRPCTVLAAVIGMQTNEK
jgi:hypothetical protein